MEALRHDLDQVAWPHFQSYRLRLVERDGCLAPSAFGTAGRSAQGDEGKTQAGGIRGE